jgi:Zn-dependent metalloprotease
MTIQHRTPCGAIPPHILERLAEQSAGRGASARTTLEHTRKLALDRAGVLVDTAADAIPEVIPSRKRRNVYDAGHEYRLPGKLVMSERHPHTADVAAREAYVGCGKTSDLFTQLFHRPSIDGRGMRLDSTVHYGEGFSNALWTGEQMVYGDGDGEIFVSFTRSIDVIGHELTHAFTQYTAQLFYFGQSGALNEHISDVFGSMVKQWVLGQTARKSDWLIGADLFGPNVKARGVRSMSEPGTAYDDPILGRDPQPAHMDGYVETDEDYGGVHINSGIPNRAFYLSSIRLGGYAWQIAGRVWFIVVTERLKPEADFRTFARATIDVAGEQYGNGLAVQLIIRNAWRDVGIDLPLYAASSRPQQSNGPQLTTAAAAAPPLSKWRQRSAR